MANVVAADEGGPKLANRAIGKGPAKLEPKFTNVARGKSLSSVKKRRK